MRLRSRAIDHTNNINEPTKKTETFIYNRLEIETNTNISVSTVVIELLIW